MTLAQFVSFSSLFIFLLYLISINFLGNAPKRKAGERPPFGNITIMPKSKNVAK